jgi:hypothetical protein
MLASRLRLVVCLAALLVPAPALAQKGQPSVAVAERQDQARAKAKEGLKLYEAGRTEEAYASFREAYELYQAPTIAIYVARCQRKLGKLIKARTSYERLLAGELPRDAAPPFVKAHADAGKELNELRAVIPSLRVAVVGAAAGAARVTVEGAVWLDDKMDLDPGSYAVEVRVKDAAPLRRVVVLIEGSHETLTIDAGGARSAEPGGPAGAVPNRVPAIVAFGMGGAGAVLGAVFGGLALAQASDVKATCGTAPPVCRGYATKAAFEQDVASVRTRTGVAGAGIGLAVAGVAVGAVLYAAGVPKAAAQVTGAVGPQGITIRF